MAPGGLRSDGAAGMNGRNPAPGPDRERRGEQAGRHSREPMAVLASSGVFATSKTATFFFFFSLTKLPCCQELFLELFVAYLLGCLKMLSMTCHDRKLIVMDKSRTSFGLLMS